MHKAVSSRKARMHVPRAAPSLPGPPRRAPGVTGHRQLSARVVYVSEAVVATVSAPAPLPTRKSSFQMKPSAPASTIMSRGADQMKAARTPGQLDATFQVDASVAQWQAFKQPLPLAMILEPGQATQSAQPVDLWPVIKAVAAQCTSDPQAALYFAYHIARSGYFGSLANTTLLLTDLLLRRQQDRLQARMQELPGTTSIFLLECMHAWLQEYNWIKRGVYKMPWDMLALSARQNNPFVIMQRAVAYLQEGWLQNERLAAPDSHAAHTQWLQGPMYPQYFTKSFHFQTDGWFSSHSAERHADFQEVAFGGINDVMQRMSLVPIHNYISSNRKSPGQMKLLEVGAGVARFHTFVKDNWPEMRTVCSDLSPFYLQEARTNLQEWKQLRHPHRDLGGRDGNGVEYLQTAAEQLDLSDHSVDIVVSVYLFHELPPSIRRKAAQEMFRVLKPGGLCIMTDSVQLGDRPAWDQQLHIAGHGEEPHYVGYIREDMAALFGGAGFKPGQKLISAAVKTLSFIKPRM